MTQEELDAMMDGADSFETQDDDITKDEHSAKEQLHLAPNITSETQVVKQLENVTKESEEKAAEVFDKLSNISDEITNSTKITKTMEDKITYFDNIFKTLLDRFPNIKTFEDAIVQLDNCKDNIKQLQQALDSSNDDAFDAMDTMQFQDIHRQKIERVINVMRALAKYMNDLLDGKINDKSRVGSANHINGDITTQDVVDNDDIEALLEQFGKK
jgi:ribosome-binding protein aMBF1 (putative translation factor)